MHRLAPVRSPGTKQEESPGGVAEAEGRAFSRTWRSPTAGGAAIPHHTLRGMEDFFGDRFGAVRMHSAATLPVPNADAVAVGEAIVFRGGVPDFTDSADTELLRHELAHVTQHRDGTSARSDAEPAARQRVAARAAGAVHAFPSYHLPAPATAPVPLGGKRKKERRRKAREEHERLIEAGRQATARENMATSKLVGHDVGAQFDPRKDGAFVAGLQEHIGGLKTEKRRQKQAVMAEAYARRATYAGDLTFKEKGDHPERDAFKNWFTKDGPYVGNLTRPKIQHKDVARGIDDPSVTYHRDKKTRATDVLRNGRHVYTLHSGASAYDPVEGDTEREVFRKKEGGVPQEQRKQYVQDDRGTYTPRLAWAVKSSGQQDVLREKGRLRGKFVSPQAWSAETRGRVADGERHLADAGDKRGLRRGAALAPNRFPRSQDVMRATQVEQRELGETPAAGAYHSNPDNMLFIHQWQGSGDRQRGVSATTTPYPLLSNDGLGFATDSSRNFQRDPGARRLAIDLARIPKPRTHEGMPEPAPNLYNYHAADNLQYPDMGKYPSADNKKLIRWSTGKNREIFIRKLPRKAVVPPDPDHPEELGHQPSPLEDMTYLHEAGWSRDHSTHVFNRLKATSRDISSRLPTTIPEEADQEAGSDSETEEHEEDDGEERKGGRH